MIERIQSILLDLKELGCTAISYFPNFSNIIFEATLDGKQIKLVLSENILKSL